MQSLGLPLTLLGGALGLFAAAHALLNKRRPQSALGWIAVCLMLPFAGPLLYYLFGINRVQTRARALRASTRLKRLAPPSDEPLQLHGNSVAVLHSGEEAFPAMLDAIRSAERHVYLATYIFGSDEVGRCFVSALADAAARGADVRVLLDGIGELYTWPRAGRLLAAAGVRFARFLPPRLLPPTLRINLRNHRKILVADDIAFAGGINIAERHLVADGSKPRRVVDVHFRFEGAVVGPLAEAFLRDWSFVTREALSQYESTRETLGLGKARCRVITDGPDESRDPLVGLLLRSLASAERRVAIMTPYFLPPRELIGALQAAALKGVEVMVMLPEKNNLPYVHWASRHMQWELLERGVQIYYQPGPFVHSKLLLIDDAHAIVGSWNIDTRSLRLNFELAVEITDLALVRRLWTHFHAARERSSQVTLAEVDARRLPARLRDGIAWLLSPYL